MKRPFSFLAAILATVWPSEQMMPALAGGVRERPALPGRKPSGVRAARRAAMKRRNRGRGK